MLECIDQAMGGVTTAVGLIRAAAKVLTPNDFVSLEDVEQPLRLYEDLSNRQPRPFEWKFTRAKLAEFLKRLEAHGVMIGQSDAAKKPPTRISAETLWLRHPTNIYETEHLG